MLAFDKTCSPEAFTGREKGNLQKECVLFEKAEKKDCVEGKCAVLDSNLTGHLSGCRFV